MTDQDTPALEPAVLTYWPILRQNELRTHRLTGDGSWILGREPGGADIVLPDPFISKRHARLTIDGRTVHIADLGSRNGTFVNNRQASNSDLRHDQIVRIGETCFAVRLPPGLGARTPRLTPPIRIRIADPQHREAAGAVARVDSMIGGDWIPIKRQGGLDRLLALELGVSETRARHVVDDLARSLGIGRSGSQRLQAVADHLLGREARGA